MAKSFAVWVEGKPDNNQASKICIDELHINFWCTRKPLINCIDLGVKFTFNNSDAQKIQEDDEKFLNIFIPFPITKDRIHDLSGKMDANKDLVSAIFNDYVSVTRNVKTKHVVYNLASNPNSFLALNTSLDFKDVDGRYDNRVRVVVNDEYTKISFKLSKCVIDSEDLSFINNKEDLKYYIRLRLEDLKPNEINALIHKTENSDKFLKPFKDELVVIDFRINELRVLPMDVRVSLANACACPHKYHLFVIRDETDEYQLSHSGQSFKKCRILEGETWQKYFEEDIFKKEQSSMIYHWEKDCRPKKDASCNIDSEEMSSRVEHNKKIKSINMHKMTDFIAVAKFKQTESPILTIIIYVLVIVFLSIFSNYIYDLIKAWFDSFKS
ncbi:hypothetical protein GNG26_00330 [Leclercia sp. J807]|uniref:hypothetical protein n=1 Tax=Leclercia sp. J807 TaxID=2681307 RepID=UPI0012E0FDC2|nr:hypothetical protein [Leclercia sp. J807]QGU08878.1 hypothetical protein GNG26_00330 [Leclercia sp. J807]